MDKANIVLITVDCLRSDRLASSSSSRRAVAPTLTHLANNSVSFTDCSAGGCWTQASFPVLLTSTYASMYNGCLGALSRLRPYLPRILQSAGYETIGVQTSPLLGKAYDYNRGFDAYIELTPHRKPQRWYEYPGAQRLLRNRLFQRILGTLRLEGRPAPAYAPAHEVTTQALQAVSHARPPFFLWIHYMDAHWPYYDNDLFSTPEQIAQAWNDRRRAHRARAKEGGRHPEEETVERWVALYEDAIAMIDEQIGRLLDEMDDGATCIAVTADHGEELFERGRFGHYDGNLYEEILQVPLILQLPHSTQGTEIKQAVSLIDLAPTLLDIAGDRIPDSMLGKSLLPIVAGENTPAPPIIAEGRWEPEAHRIAIREDGFKFIVDLRHPEQFELYDLGRDPGERCNLNGRHEKRTAHFQELLSQHLTLVRASELEIKAEMGPVVSREVAERLRALGYTD